MRQVKVAVTDITGGQSGGRRYRCGNVELDLSGERQSEMKRFAYPMLT
jgi:hypothetical protein